jgi:hypothetical protein
MIEEVFIVNVLSSVIGAMIVPKYPATIPASNFTVNYEPGRTKQILDALATKDGSSLSALKYPLIAVVMPIQEKSGSGFLEVTFPRIVIAHLTKTGTNSEFVKSKYSSDGIFQNILRVCERQFIEKLAWSTYTSQGDPDAYEYERQDSPSQQPIGQGLNDFVDITEILNLKAIFYSQIKSC